MYAPKPLVPAAGTGRTVTNYNRLIKVGFSPEQARFLVENTSYVTGYAKRYTFSRNQARTLIAGSLTMAKLLRGGFTRNQAKVLLEVVV